MCIAILNKVGTLPKEYIQNSWDNNYHGAGFAYSDGTRIVVHKQDKDVDSFYNKYKKARKKYPNSKFLIHFRISTHGTISIDNLHPFVINDNVAFIHNGMVDLDGHTHADKRSDTRYLCEEILANLPDGWMHSVGIHKFLENIAGWSKFVMLDVNDEYVIINEDEGHWFEDNWYSNNSYKQVNRYIDYGGKKVERDTTTTKTSTNTKTSSGWDDDDWYGSSYKNDNISIPFQDTTKIEKHILDSGLVTSNHSVYSTYIKKDVYDAATMIQEAYGDGSRIKKNTWYHIDDDKSPKQDRWELCVVNVGGKDYTLIGKPNQASAHGSFLSAYPFAIQHETLVVGLLQEFKSSMSYSTASDKLAAVIDDNHWLAQEAEFLMLGDSVENDAVEGMCDCCMEMTNIKDLKMIDDMPEYYACNSCQRTFKSVLN
jgi:glutamine amidotransferase